MTLCDLTNSTLNSNLEEEQGWLLQSYLLWQVSVQTDGITLRTGR